MKIISAEFIKSAVSVTGLPKDDRKHIAFVGRSNVGKSTLMNTLMGKKLARTSSTPGKTRELNFFLINEAFYFVDMPGYGYAKASHSEKEKWKTFLESYFKLPSLPHLTILLIDARHLISSLDIEMLSFLNYYKKAFSVVLTKTDKTGNQLLLKMVHEAERTFNNAKAIQTFSATKGTGKKEIFGLIMSTIHKPH